MIERHNVQTLSVEIIKMTNEYEHVWTLPSEKSQRFSRFFLWCSSSALGTFVFYVNNKNDHLRLSRAQILMVNVKKKRRWLGLGRLPPLRASSVGILVPNIEKSPITLHMWSRIMHAQILLPGLARTKPCSGRRCTNKPSGSIEIPAG